MFHGSLVALVTPMHEDGSIDYNGLFKLVDWHLENETDGLVILGSTGESATIEANEREKLIISVINRVKDRIPVIVGTGSNSTHHTILLTQQAMELGADAALIVVPYYNKPTQEGLYQHFKMVAKAVPIPQILYNVPSRTITDLKPECVQRLTECNNIIGIKEATGNLERIDQLKNCGIDLYSGDDNSAIEFMLKGGKGWITVVGNILPQLTHRITIMTSEGKREESIKVGESLKELLKILNVESNPIPVKWALKEMGMINADLRLPLTPLSVQFRELLATELRTRGLIESPIG